VIFFVSWSRIPILISGCKEKNDISTEVIPGIGHLSIGVIPDIVYRESIPSSFADESPLRIGGDKRVCLVKALKMPGCLVPENAT